MDSIVTGSDMSGFVLKEAVKAHLIERGFDVTDVGTLSEDKPVDYEQVGIRLGKAVSGGEFARGIIICGTGMGVSLMANKFPGVYCGLCESVYAVDRARTYNNINVLAMGGFFQAPELGIKMTDTFLDTEWKQGQDGKVCGLLQRAYDNMRAEERRIMR